MNIHNWPHSIVSRMETWLEDHLVLPVILIALAIIALVHPRFVYEFLFPSKDRRKHEID